MGVWWAGMEGMGLKRLGWGPAMGHHTHAPLDRQGAPAGMETLYAYPSKQVALQKAAELGCQGVHAMGSLWMPCEQHPDGVSTLRQNTTVDP